MPIFFLTYILAILLMVLFIIYTNLGSSLFIFYSLLFLPQIYHNAVTGKRPDPTSSYYIEFLKFRFLIVVIFYLFSVVSQMLPLQYFLVKAELSTGVCVPTNCQFPICNFVDSKHLWAQKSIPKVSTSCIL